MSSVEEFHKAESDAKSTAAKHVANMLQKPGQLEKVDQYKRRIARKKASVEARLKTAVQSQLDGVRTGLTKLQSALEEIQEIRQSLKEVDEMYTACEEVNAKLEEVKTVGAEHSQLAAAVENLKHIFTVPESVEKTRFLIDEEKYLNAHKCLMDLENSRDDLLFELHKQPSDNPSDDYLLKRYFADVESLSNALAKQLWLVLQRMLLIVRKDPTMLVTALRIIEREERNDQRMADRQKLTGFLPPGRPKQWKAKCFEVLEQVAETRIEANQIEDREGDKMWLVRHLELTRMIILDDLRVIKITCQPCFPPEYEIFDRFVKIYHKCLSNHLQDLISDQLKDTEIVSLLSWLKEYEGPDLMKHPDLKVNLKELGALLSSEVEAKLKMQYLDTMRTNIQTWMQNTIQTDIKDWYRDTEPEADGDGYFLTQLPVILFQMIEQNLQVATHISEHLTINVLLLCIENIGSFVKMYRDAIIKYKNKHLEDRSQPQFYIHYMIAIINNCQKFTEFTEQLEIRHTSSNATNTSHCQPVVIDFDKLATETYRLLLDEVFLDLESHLQQILTRTWHQLKPSNAVDTICITMEDYYNDFVHLKPKYCKRLINDAQYTIALSYIKALTEKRMVFKSYDERKSAAEKIEREAEQLELLFQKLAPDNNPSNSPCQPIPMLSELIKLEDTSVIPLEISTLATKYPDVHPEHIISVLLARGDLSRSEARQMVTETLGEYNDGDTSRSSVAKGIFSQVPIPQTKIF